MSEDDQPRNPSLEEQLEKLSGAAFLYIGKAEVEVDKVPRYILAVRDQRRDKKWAPWPSAIGGIERSIVKDLEAKGIIQIVGDIKRKGTNEDKKAGEVFFGKFDVLKDGEPVRLCFFPTKKYAEGMPEYFEALARGEVSPQSSAERISKAEYEGLFKENALAME